MLMENGRVEASPSKRRSRDWVYKIQALRREGNEERWNVG